MVMDEIVFNPEKPLAHYPQGHERYLNYRSSLSFGTVSTIAAFIPGILSVLYHPTALAIFVGTALPFTLLALIGCHARRPKMCLFSLPLALIAGIAALIAGSVLSVFSSILYAVAIFAVYKAAHDTSVLTELKELPGYPVFDASLSDPSFALLDEMGADELFSDEPLVYEEVRGERFIAPLEPSEDMEELFTEGMAVIEEEKKLTAFEREIAEEVDNVPEYLRDEVAQSLGHFTPNLAEYEKAADNENNENSERAYEKMVKLQKGKNNNISDVDLFG